MVERVVEDKAFVLFEMFYIVTYSHACSFNTYQRQVNSKLLACRTIVRCNVTPWSQSTEESVEIVSWNYFLQNINGFRDFFTVFLKLNIMEVEVKDIPVA